MRQTIEVKLASFDLQKISYLPVVDDSLRIQHLKELKHVNRFRAFGVIRVDGSVADEALVIDKIASWHREPPCIDAVDFGKVDAEFEIDFGEVLGEVKGESKFFG